jgi:serine/threonine protein kinase/WD40 repeat protein/formylglycine-generating enzyme required for sulfatase activity
MQTQGAIHPADETLVSYGLGKLAETVAASVNRHLEECPPCRQRVAELSGDSFVGRLREAKPRTRESSVRPKTIAESEPSDAARSPVPDDQASVGDMTGSSKDEEKGAAAQFAGSVPPELANHPQYAVTRELGRGGMGIVYLARNKLMDRLEVLKLLSQEMLGKQERVERFLREIQAAAKLHHPNVVAAYTAFPMGKMLVFAMEYVEGDDLAKLVRVRGPLPVLNACYFAYQTALGLQHAHERGMIHRDIKPGNLILFRQGKKATVKILDFGLAKITSDQKVDGTLTQQGQMLGTPDYIAPEQTLDAQKADIRSDIYSLGCTLYHLLTGSPPFSGSSLYAVLQAHHSTEARMVNLVRPEVPVELAAAVAKMMAKEPNRRYQTPAEVAQAIKPFLKPGGLASVSSQSPPSVSRIDRPSSKMMPAEVPAADDDDEDLALTPMREIEAAERWKSLIDAPFLTPSGVRRAIPKSRKRHLPWVWVAAGTGALFLGLVIAWAGGAFSVKTREGVIVLKNLPPDADVFVDGEKVTVALPGAGAPAEIAVVPGRHEVRVKKGEITARGNEVTVLNGSREVIEVKFEPVQPSQPEIISKAGGQNTSITMGSPVRAKSEPDPKAGQNGPLGPISAFIRRNSASSTDMVSEFRGRNARDTRKDNELATTLVWVPPGEFDMGSSKDEQNWLENEHQVHVTLTRGFWLGQHEVTQSEWQRVMRTTPWRGKEFVKEGETYPASHVDWNDAMRFCKKLTVQESNAGRLPVGWEYTLPTEAQWEYACRAGTTSRYFFGDDDSQLPEYAWCKENASNLGENFGHPVGMKRPNPFGIFDTYGNVAELCSDRYGKDLVGGTDPKGPATGSDLVQRGGASGNDSRVCRSAYRQPAAPDFRSSWQGFRIAAVERAASPIRLLEGHTGKVWCVAFSPDGKRLLSGSNSHYAVPDPKSGGHVNYPGDDNTVRLWEVDTGRQVVVLRGHTWELMGLAFFPNDNNRAAACSSTDWATDYASPTVTVYNLTSGEVEHRFSLPPRPAMRAIAVFPDGKKIAVSRSDRTIETWDLATEKKYDTLSLEGKGGEVALWGSAFSADRGRLAGGLRGGPVRLWDAQSGSVLKHYLGHTSRVLSVALSPDEKRIVSASEDGTARVWDVESAKELLLLKGHGKAIGLRSENQNWVTSVTFSPDGSRILSGGLDGTVRLWDASNGKELRRCEGHTAPVRAVAISPDGQLVASGGDDTAIRLWRLDGFARNAGMMGIGMGKGSDGEPQSTQNSAGRVGFGLGSARPTFGLGGRGNEVQPSGGLKPASQGKFVPLFNGKVLNGWNEVHSDTIEWHATNGELVGTNRGGAGSGGALVTQRTDYADFHLRSEIMLSDGLNTMVGFRRNSSEVPGAKRQYCVLIRGTKQSSFPELPDNPQQPTGTLMMGMVNEPPEIIKEAAKVTLKPGEWFTLEIIAQGKRIRVKIKGHTVVDYVDSADTFPVGSIAISCRMGSKVQFRNLEIKELSPERDNVQPGGAAVLGMGGGFGGIGGMGMGRLGNGVEKSNGYGFGPPSKEKFVRLFNGEDFKNWTFPKGGQEKWSIEAGVLRGDGQSRIATERADFKNFHLRMRLRTPDQINKHLIFRSRDDDGNDANYRFHLGGIKWDHKSTWLLGSYTLLTGEPLKPGQSGTTEGLEKLNFLSMPFLDDKWHRVEIIALNNVFRMILDGQEVSAFRDTRSRFSEGQIVIGLVEGAHLELRDIEINEIPSKTPVQGTKKPRRKSVGL